MQFVDQIVTTSWSQSIVALGVRNFVSSSVHYQGENSLCCLYTMSSVDTDTWMSFLRQPFLVRCSVSSANISWCKSNTYLKCLDRLTHWVCPFKCVLRLFRIVVSAAQCSIVEICTLTMPVYPVVYPRKTSVHVAHWLSRHERRVLPFSTTPKRYSMPLYASHHTGIASLGRYTFANARNVLQRVMTQQVFFSRECYISRYYHMHLPHEDDVL